MTPSPPRRWATLVVALATRVLPPDLGHRYRRELAAELWGLDRREQLMLTLGFLSRAIALRRAWSGVTREAPHSQAWCRLRLHHRWAVVWLADGGRYRHCRACGIDEDGTYHQRSDSVLRSWNVQSY